MGTPPASGSLDQMRRMQLAARGDGECAWLNASASFENSIRRTVGSGSASGCRITADKKPADAAATALSGEDCIWSDGGQQRLTAQHPAQVMAGHLPGIWQVAGIASSGCETVATVNSKITSAFFTRAGHTIASLLSEGERAWFAGLNDGGAEFRSGFANQSGDAVCVNARLTAPAKSTAFPLPQ